MLFTRGASVVALLAGIASIGVSQALSADPSDSQEHASQQAEQNRQQPFLGVKVLAMRPGAMRKLPEEFRSGQGVRVAAVMPDSPADKAGIQRNDIILSFDDQKLFSPLQLAGLVRSDKSGREAALTVLRGDKTEQIKVTLGSQERRLAARDSKKAEGATPENENPLAVPQEPRPMHNGQARGTPQAASSLPPGKPNGNESSQAANPNGTATNGETFDSMLLENIGRDRFKVQIEYLNKSGQLEKHKFEGDLKELHQKIVAEKDLPAAERAQLLRSLDLPAELGTAPSISSRANPER
jgi:membrane-associated protease RseP (regulator of RpoE activity)